MNWNAHPYLYQITHWWHWLAYGQNASVLGVLGLLAYVIYTRRMMVAAEETRRLSLTPFLVGSVGEDSGRPILSVTNVAAPAVRCEVWIQVTDPGTRLGLRFRRPSNVNVTHVHAIVQGKDLELPMYRVPDDSDILYVIDCFDTANGRYQLQMLQRFISGDRFEIESSFSIPDTFQPTWKRVVSRSKQLYRLQRYRRKPTL